MTLPRKAVTLLTGSLGKLVDHPERIIVTEQACSVLLVNGGVLVARTIESIFPDYENVMPNDHPYTLLTPRSTLVEAITTTSVVTDGLRNKPVSLILDTTPRVHASDPDSGTVTTPIEGAAYNGEPLTIGFNARYLLDALNACEQETVTLQVKDATAPLRIDNGTFTAIIMPLRV